jgi:F-type H+-transporting ATPase subunit delta
LVDQLEELTGFIASPLYGASAQIAVLGALMKKLKSTDLTIRFVHLVAKNRRLGFLPHMIKEYQGLVAHMRGEITAEVTSAIKLSATQNKKIATALKKSLGQAVQIKNTIDPQIMGGLIVRIGSKMIDTSLKSRLNTLETTLKGI